MEGSNDDTQFDTKLKIAFPKSSEDHRLQLVDINGSVFAILFAPLESNGPIQLYCDDWSLVLLSPIKSKSNIVVSAINIICLNEIESEEGLVNLHSSNQFVTFAHLIKPSEKVHIVTEGGEFQCNEDPGAFLYYSRSFESIIRSTRADNPESLAEAQQSFIKCLCALAGKIEGNANDLNLLKVLKLWGIPSFKSD